jgi:hypothetical protein
MDLKAVGWECVYWIRLTQGISCLAEQLLATQDALFPWNYRTEKHIS